MLLSILCLNQFCSRASAFYDSVTIQKLFLMPVCALIGANREVMVVGHMWTSSCDSTVIVFSSYHQGFVCQFLYSD